MDTPSMPTPTPSSSGSGSNKKILLIILAVVLGLGLLSMVGSFLAAKAVSFGIKKAVETGTGIKIDENNGTFTLNGKNGEQVTLRAEQGKLPGNFTRDFPIHGSMTAVGGSVTQAPKGNLETGIWTSTASVEELNGWYRSELAAKGWEVNTTIGGSTGDGAIIVFSRGDGDTEEGGQLNIRTDEEGRVVLNVFMTIRN